MHINHTESHFARFINDTASVQVHMEVLQNLFAVGADSGIDKSSDSDHLLKVDVECASATSTKELQ